MYRKLNEKQRQLAENYFTLARALSKNLKQKIPYLWEEFESAACIALVEAARDYDESQKINFATFARFRIRGALSDVGKKENVAFMTLSPVLENQGKVLLVEEETPVGYEFENIDTVENILRKLPSNHAYVCRMYYLYGNTYEEIAHKINRSTSEARRLLYESLKLLGKKQAINFEFKKKSKVKKVCNHCSDSFEANKSFQIYCSDKCRYKNKGKHIEYQQ